jgi:hypothetical protein
MPGGLNNIIIVPGGLNRVATACPEQSADDEHGNLNLFHSDVSPEVVNA